MNINVETYDFTNQKIVSEFVKDFDLPTKCPHCNQTGIQQFVNGVLIEDNSKEKNLFFYGQLVKSFSIVTCCLSCKNYSTNIINYQNDSRNDSYYISLESTFPPFEEIENDPPQNIKDEYPNFYNIWKEATEAKNSGLHNLAGMGYRKSIEFLTTDYLLKNPIEGVTEDWITSPKTTLIQKINKLDKPRLVTLGKAIAYLGNDETHYTRIHEDYSMDDLISFIDLFISEIESDLKFTKAEKLIKRPKK